MGFFFGGFSGACLKIVNKLFLTLTLQGVVSLIVVFVLIRVHVNTICKPTMSNTYIYSYVLMIGLANARGLRGQKKSGVEIWV